MCRLATDTPFKICVMNSNGTGDVEVLTNNAMPDLTPGWSPDGTRISFFRGFDLQQQIYVMNYLADENGDRHEQLLTTPPSTAFFPNWGTIAVGCGGGVSSRSVRPTSFQSWTNAAIDLYRRWFARLGTGKVETQVSGKGEHMARLAVVLRLREHHHDVSGCPAP